MVQTLAALLSWIAMLALIAIAVLVSGVWRPRARANLVPTPAQPLLSRAVAATGPARVKPQSNPQPIRKSDARDIPRDIARVIPRAMARDAGRRVDGQPRRAA